MNESFQKIEKATKVTLLAMYAAFLSNCGQAPSKENLKDMLSKEKIETLKDLDRSSLMEVFDFIKENHSDLEVTDVVVENSTVPTNEEVVVEGDMFLTADSLNTEIKVTISKDGEVIIKETDRAIFGDEKKICGSYETSYKLTPEDYIKMSTMDKMVDIKTPTREVTIDNTTGVVVNAFLIDGVEGTPKEFSIDSNGSIKGDKNIASESVDFVNGSSALLIKVSKFLKNKIK